MMAPPPSESSGVVRATPVDTSSNPWSPAYIFTPESGVESYLEQCEWQLALLNTPQVLAQFINKHILSLWTLSCPSTQRKLGLGAASIKRIVGLVSLLYQKINVEKANLPVEVINPLSFYRLGLLGIGIFPVGILMTNLVTCHIVFERTEPAAILLRESLLIKEKIGLAGIAKALGNKETSSFDAVDRMFCSYSFSWLLLSIDGMKVAPNVSTDVRDACTLQDWRIISEVLCLFFLYPWPGLSAQDKEIVKPSMTVIEKKLNANQSMGSVLSSTGLIGLKKKLLDWWCFSPFNSRLEGNVKFIPLILGSSLLASQSEVASYCTDILKKRIGTSPTTAPHATSDSADSLYRWHLDSALAQDIIQWYLGSPERGRACAAIAMKCILLGNWLSKFTVRACSPTSVESIIRDILPILNGTANASSPAVVGPSSPIKEEKVQLEKVPSGWLRIVLDFVAHYLERCGEEKSSIQGLKEPLEAIVLKFFPRPEERSSVLLNSAIAESYFHVLYEYIKCYSNADFLVHFIQSLLDEYEGNPGFCNGSRFYSLSIEKLVQSLEKEKSQDDRLLHRVNELFQINYANPQQQKQMVGLKKACFIVASRLFPERKETLLMGFRILTSGEAGSGSNGAIATLDLKNDVWHRFFSQHGMIRTHVSKSLLLLATREFNASTRTASLWFILYSIFSWFQITFAQNSLILSWLKIDHFPLFGDYNAHLLLDNLVRANLIPVPLDEEDLRLFKSWKKLFFGKLLIDSRNSFSESELVTSSYWFNVILFLEAQGESTTLKDDDDQDIPAELAKTLPLMKSSGFELKNSLIYNLYLMKRAGVVALKDPSLALWLSSFEPSFVLVDPLKDAEEKLINQLIVKGARASNYEKLATLTSSEEVKSILNYHMEDDAKWLEEWNSAWKKATTSTTTKKEEEKTPSSSSEGTIFNFDTLINLLFGPLNDASCYLGKMLGWNLILKGGKFKRVAENWKETLERRLSLILDLCEKEIDKGSRKALKDQLAFIGILSLVLINNNVESEFGVDLLAEGAVQRLVKLHEKLLENLVFTPSATVGPSSVDAKLIVAPLFNLYVLLRLYKFNENEILQKFSNSVTSTLMKNGFDNLISEDNNNSAVNSTSSTVIASGSESLTSVAEVILQLSYAMTRSFKIFHLCLFLSYINNEKQGCEVPLKLINPIVSDDGDQAISSNAAYEISVSKLSKTSALQVTWALSREETKNLVLVLYPCLFEPNALVRTSGKLIFSNLFAGGGSVSNATEYFYYPDLIENLFQSLSHNSWRVRERSLLCLTELIATHGRKKGKQGAAYYWRMFDIWRVSMSLLFHEDKGSVREAAEKVCIVMIPLFVKWIRSESLFLSGILSESSSSNSTSPAGGEEMVEKVIDFLLRVVLEAEKLRGWGLQGLTKLIQGAEVDASSASENPAEELTLQEEALKQKRIDEIILKHSHKVILTLVEAMSSLEPEVISYIRFHVDNNNNNNASSNASNNNGGASDQINTFDSMRISSVISSPFMELVGKWITWSLKKTEGGEVVSLSEPLLAGFERLISQGVGLATMAATSHTICSYFDGRTSAIVPLSNPSAASGLFKTLLLRYGKSNNNTLTLLDHDSTAIISVLNASKATFLPLLVNSLCSLGQENGSAFLGRDLLAASNWEEVFLLFAKFILVVDKLKLTELKKDYGDVLSPIVPPLFLGSRLLAQGQPGYDPVATTYNFGPGWFQPLFQNGFDCFVTLTQSALIASHFSPLFDYLSALIKDARFVPVKNMSVGVLSQALEKAFLSSSSSSGPKSSVNLETLATKRLVDLLSVTGSKKQREKLIPGIAHVISSDTGAWNDPESAIATAWKQNFENLILGALDEKSVKRAPAFISSQIVPAIRLLLGKLPEPHRDHFKSCVSQQCTVLLLSIANVSSAEKVATTASAGDDEQEVVKGQEAIEMAISNLEHLIKE